MQTLRRSLLKSFAAALAVPVALPGTCAFAAAGGLPALALAGNYDEAVDPAACLVSEKFDGVRGVWDGGELRFRSGRIVPAPAWFTARLPAEPLDGELWLARGRFDALSAIVRKNAPVDADWQRVRYLVFDLPGALGAFEARASRIAELARQLAWPPLIAVEQTRVADRAALRERLAATVAQGGEGLVLHRASAPYRAGRGEAVWKLKPSLDAEATVIAHHAGQGRYAGLLGAIGVRTADGRRFLIGTGFSDAERRAPPPVGSVVTYRFRDLTGTGLPRFASYQRLHHGL